MYYINWISFVQIIKKKLLSYIKDGYYTFVKQRQENKNQTYNGWKIWGGEDLQWRKVCNGFPAPLQIFRGGEVCNGRKVCSITGAHLGSYLFNFWKYFLG